MFLGVHLANIIEGEVSISFMWCFWKGLTGLKSVLKVGQ